jgi:outer membrane protein TolC
LEKGLAVAKAAYIPDVTRLARYGYQSGVPLLVHNFGTFGFTMTYDLFDGGRRNSELKDSRVVLAQAERLLSNFLCSDFLYCRTIRPASTQRS